MQSSKDFLRCYTNGDVVPILEAIEKLVDFYHHKGVVLLKLGCTLANLANNCSHSSTSANIFPFSGRDKDFLSKFREDMVRGPSKVFTSKTLVDEIHIRKSAKFCKSTVGIIIEASQL